MCSIPDLRENPTLRYQTLIHILRNVVCTGNLEFNIKKKAYGLMEFQRLLVIYCCYLVTKLCPTFCDSMNCSPPGSTVHGVFQARILEWVAISFSRGSPQPRIEPASSAWQEDSLPLNHPGSPTGHYAIEYNFKQHKEAYLMN